MTGRCTQGTSVKRPSSATTSSNLTDLGWAAVHAGGDRIAPATPVSIKIAGREATVKVCGVAVAMPQGHSWAPPLSIGTTVNVGTHPVAPPRSTSFDGPAGRLVAS